MSTENAQHNGGPAHRADTEVLQADIARQRQALAATVQDLHDRLDVKTRAHDKAQEIKVRTQVRAHELKSRATTPDGRPEPTFVATAVAAVAALVLLTWLKRKKES